MPNIPLLAVATAIVLTPMTPLAPQPPIVATSVGFEALLGTMPERPPPMPSWGSLLLNPAQTMKDSFVSFGPAQPAVAALPRESRSTGVHPIIYTAHRAAPVGTEVVPVRIDDAFTPHQRAGILQAIKDWNQVLNGFVRLEVTTSERNGWYVAADKNSAVQPSADSVELAVTQRRPSGGGVVIVHLNRVNSLDLSNIMRHEFGHVLGLDHDDEGELMSARYSQHKQRCVDRRAAQAVAAVWRLSSDELNWCTP